MRVGTDPTARDVVGLDLSAGRLTAGNALRRPRQSDTPTHAKADTCHEGRNVQCFALAWQHLENHNDTLENPNRRWQESQCKSVAGRKNLNNTEMAAE